jgi:2-hydroxy-3-keto-5-methylthiopentenyl-1-phosphate phosphatase
MIGDGRSDFCVADNADFVFTKNGLIAHCFEKSLSHVSISGFADALRMICPPAEAGLPSTTRSPKDITHE